MSNINREGFGRLPVDVAAAVGNRPESGGAVAVNYKEDLNRGLDDLDCVALIGAGGSDCKEGHNGMNWDC